MADVTRPLHSASQVAGPYEGAGNQDVLSNNKRCVVVPPGEVEAVMGAEAAIEFAFDAILDAEDAIEARKEVVFDPPGDEAYLCERLPPPANC